MIQWDSLPKQEQIKLELKASLDVEFFCTNEYFLDLKLYDEPKNAIPDNAIGNTQKDILKELFRKDEKGNSIYNEIVFAVGMRASKTFLASVCTAYETFGLLLHEDPAKHYNLAKGSEIFLINAATNDDQAKDTIFAQDKARIDNSPWFQSIERNYKERTNEFRFPDQKVVIRSGGSNSDALVGKTAKLVLFDELDRFLSTAGRRSGMMVYDSLSKSVGSFGHEGKKVSLSSPLTDTGVIYTLARRYANLEVDEDIPYGVYTHKSKMVVHLPTWMINPTLSYDMLYEEYGQYDMATMMRDFGAKPVGGSDLFYRDPSTIKLEKAVNDANYFCDNPDNAKAFYWTNLQGWTPKTGVTYYAWGDPAQTEDAFGIAIAHLENKKPVIDAIFRLVPDDKIALVPSEIRDIWMNIIKLYNPKQIGFDQNRYPEMTEEIVRKGKTVIIHNDSYNTHIAMKSRILNKTVDIPYSKRFLKELKGLRQIGDKKVEHIERKNEGKDMVDAAAGVIWLMCDNKPKQVKGSTSQLPFAGTTKMW